MNKKLKKRLRKIIFEIFAFCVIVLIGKLFKEADNSYIYILAYILLYIYVAGDVLKKAFTMLLRGRPTDENFLMSVASIGAFLIGSYSEGVAVILFYQVGEFFQSLAVNKSRKSIKELMDIKPETANLLVAGTEQQVKPSKLMPGDIIVIKPGEKIPVDSIVTEGNSTIDTKALTGESIPVDAEIGVKLISGCINCDGLLKARVLKAYSESTVSKILNLINQGQENKSKKEDFITRFARVYTPIVVTMAIFVMVIPGLLFGDFISWIYRGLSFLVISCPCALVISIPLSFFGGIGGAGRRGILVKGSKYLEELSAVSVVAFDKTGTITKGNFALKSIYSFGTDENKVLELAALAESGSNHPIAKSILKAYGTTPDLCKLQSIKEIPGRGIIFTIEDKQYYLGNKCFIDKLGIDVPLVEDNGTFCYLATEKKTLGALVIADEERENSKKTVELLGKMGIKSVMLTGDRKELAEYIGQKVGIKEIYSELLPNEKVEIIDELIRNNDIKSNVVFVGDGINDTPVLSNANIGVAMGKIGSDAAIEAADIVIMDDDPVKLLEAIKISRFTLKIVKENIFFALGVKIAVMAFSVFGYASMWSAVFADVGVAVIAILNAARPLFWKSNRKLEK